MQVYIANIGRASFLWPECRNKGQIVVLDDEKVHPFWLARNPAGYFAYALKHMITNAGTPVSRARSPAAATTSTMTLVVPVGWTVKISFTIHDGMLPHSMLVTKQYCQGRHPPGGGQRPGRDQQGLHRNPIGGLAPNDKNDFSFKTTEAGNFWLLCGVPGHGQQGMYVDLKVDPAAEKPEVVVAKEAAAGRP